MITLRPYQEASLRSLWGYFEQCTGAPIVVLPTASGKSIVIAEWIRGVIHEFPDTNFLILSHVAELLSQNLDELLSLWPDAPAGIFSASLKRRELQQQITFAGIQSIHKHAFKIPHRIDMVLIDECHLVPNKATGTYRKFLNDLLTCNPCMKVIGLSASPYRLGSGLLTEGEDALFTDIAYEAEVLPLVRDGYLSPLVTSPTETELDVAGVSITNGDYTQGELERAVNVDAITEAAVREIVASGADRRSWIVFCSGVAHAHAVRDEIARHGISVGTITKETPKTERADLLAAFKAGTVRCLTNNNVLTTGINVRGIDLIAFLRPTKSTALYVQMAGRGMRLSPETQKQDCLVLDFARLIGTFGPIDQIKVKPKGKGVAPTKFCESCKARVFASARECPNCGAPFPEPKTQGPSVTSRASKLAILSDQQPGTEWVQVNGVRFRKHEKAGKPPSIEVTYQCGMTQHREWVCVEHPGYPRQKACSWWARRMPGVPVPMTVDDAISVLQEREHHVAPVAIQVRPVGKYTEIVSARFA